LFQRNTGLVFDAFAPAAAAADMTLSFLLFPERATRLVQQKALHPTLPGLTDILDRVVADVFDYQAVDGYTQEVNRAVQRTLVDRMIRLSSSAPMPQVRAETSMALLSLRDRLINADHDDVRQRAHDHLLQEDIRRFLERPHGLVEASGAPSPPPGSPIGEPSMAWLTWQGSGFSSPWQSYDWWWN
jgi:hypothetical protein